MNGLIQDLRYALRILATSPGFTSVAVLSLALGIGANTAIFSVANAVLFRPLPFPEPDRLISIDEVMEGNWSPGRRVPPLVNYLFQKDQLSSFSHISGFEVSSRHLTGVDDSESLHVGLTTEEFFPMLGVRPLHGRMLDGDDLSKKARVLVISHDFWMRQFGGDPDLTGRIIRLNDESFTVIGILPAGFRFPWMAANPQLWAPLSLFPPYGRHDRWRPH